MPIRAENRGRYPADWPQISRRVRDRAGDRCEFCAVPNGATIRRAVAEGMPVWRHEYDPCYLNSRSAIDGSEVAGSAEDDCDFGKPVRVILTVAHLDHQPENCADDNLRALCQRCHNHLDAATRRAGTAARAKASRALADLFQDHIQ